MPTAATVDIDVTIKLKKIQFHLLRITKVMQTDADNELMWLYLEFFHIHQSLESDFYHVAAVLRLSFYFFVQPKKIDNKKQ